MSFIQITASNVTLYAPQEISTTPIGTTTTAVSTSSFGSCNLDIANLVGIGTTYYVGIGTTIPNTSYNLYTLSPNLIQNMTADSMKNDDEVYSTHYVNVANVSSSTALYIPNYKSFTFMDNIAMTSTVNLYTEFLPSPVTFNTDTFVFHYSVDCYTTTAGARSIDFIIKAQTGTAQVLFNYPIYFNQVNVIHNISGTKIIKEGQAQVVSGIVALKNNPIEYVTVDLSANCFMNTQCTVSWSVWAVPLL